MGLAMTYLRLAPGEPAGTGDNPREAVRPLFEQRDWRDSHDADRVLDLGDRWQGLHYLLTGDLWEGERPEADAVCGGVLFTDDDELREAIGVDVVYLTPDRVAATAEYLAETPYGSVAERFDPKAMAKLGVEGKWTADSAESLQATYARLTDFFGKAAADGEAIFKTMG